MAIVPIWPQQRSSPCPFLAPTDSCNYVDGRRMAIGAKSNYP
nr:MAG TPA: hypothetical protein [Caudoviricetes sp.]